jgi:hypothetical protein
MKRYDLIIEEKFEIADAYWISPIGKIISVPMKHINSVIKDPKTYGYTKKEIDDLHKKYNERIGQEGKARHSILINLIMKGWMRIRNYPRRGSWTINVNRLTKKTKDYIQNFASLLIKNKNDKYDIVSIDTLGGNRSYHLIDLSRDILYTEGINMKKYKFTDLLKEGKLDYEIYHDDYGGAIGEIKKFADKNGYTVDEDEFSNNYMDAFNKPKKGKTYRTTLKLYKNDKQQKKALHSQIYNRGTNRNTFELNMYIS